MFRGIRDNNWQKFDPRKFEQKRLCEYFHNFWPTPWQHCIGACQGNNFTAFRNSDPRVGHVRIGPQRVKQGQSVELPGNEAY